MFTVPLFQGSFLEIGWNRPCLRLDKAPEKDVVVFFFRRYGFAPYTANYQKLSKKKKTLGAQSMFTDKDRWIDPFVLWDGAEWIANHGLCIWEVRATYDVGRLNTLKLLIVCPILVYFASN